MRTVEEIRERIKGIKQQQENNQADGYLPIQDVRNILISNLEWVIGVTRKWNGSNDEDFDEPVTELE